MTDKTKLIVTFICKVLVYALTTAAAVFGLGSLTSCSAYKNAQARGKTTVVTVDTTNIDHSAGFSISIKKK